MTARLQALYRYPIKGFSPEPLPAVDLARGETLPFDRAYAIENGPSGFDPASPRYLAKIYFLMLMKNASVAQVTSRFDDATGRLTLSENGAVAFEAALDTAEGRAAIEAFVNARFAAELRGPAKVLSAPGHSFSDVSAKAVHVINLDSVRDLERRTGQSIDPLRFRANLYVEGVPAWSEFGWIKRSVAIGSARFVGVKRTERCAATNVDPSEGVRNRDIPRALMQAFGHTDCGIYLHVTGAGRIAQGDGITVTDDAPELPL